MATAFDQRRTAFDTRPTAFESRPTAFDAVPVFGPPDIIDVSQSGRDATRKQMADEKRRLMKEGAAAQRLIDTASPMGILDVTGDVFRGVVNDAVGNVFNNARLNRPSLDTTAGNTIAALTMDPLPIDRTISAMAEESPGVATVSKIGQGVTKSAPLIAVMPQGALGKLVAAGFTADMLRHAGPEAAALGEEMGKNPQDRDYDRITTALSSLAQTAAFAPAAGAHAGATPLRAAGRFALEKAAPSRAAINELARALQQEPIAAPNTAGTIEARGGERRLGVRIPEGEFAQPGVRELAGEALREAQSPIVQPGRTPAIDLLRNELSPPQLDLIEPTRVAERVQGGGEAPYGKVSYQREANPFFDRASEMEGLGRPSGAPTLFDVRQSREKGGPNAVVPEAAQPVRPVRQEPIQGQGEVPGAGAGRAPDVGGRPKGGSEAAQAEMSPAAKEFAEAFNSPTAKISNISDNPDVVTTIKTGSAIDKIADLDAMLKLHREFISRNQADRQRMLAGKMTQKEMEAYGVKMSRKQFPREVIEVATNSGSNTFAGRRLTEKNYPPPKLDWTKNPEVEAWLRENGKELNIELPAKTEAKPAEVPKVEQPAMDVEAVTPLDPATGTPISKIQSFLEKADTRLAQVQEQIRRGFYKGDTAMGVPAAVLDTGLQAARLALKAGKTVAQAVDAAIAHIRMNVSKFDEAKVRELFDRELGDIERPAPPTISGGPEAMRKSAERAITSEQVPKPVQERIAEAPESFYETQRVSPKAEPDGRSVEEVVGALPDAELAAIPKESNFHVASQLELSRRLFAAGKLEEGYNVFRNVSKLGTDFGQNINQFKLLKGTTAADIIHIVNGGLKEAGRDPLTKTQMEGLGRVADKSIEANNALKNAKSEWQRNPTDANAKKAQEALDRANEADLKTQQEMNRFKVKTWPQMLKTFAQGNPLTPISHVSNFVGNTVGAVMEGGSRGAAGLVDSIRSFITSNPKLISATPKAIVASTKGFARGAKEVPSILAKGTGDVIKGEQRAGLQPLRALAKAFAKNPDVPTVGGKVPLNERIRLAVEGTFGVAPETMLRLLSAADRPAYEAARARLIEEQARLKKVPAAQRNMAQKFPELFFDKETLRQIKEESADAIFQRPSKAVANLQRLIREKGGDWADLAFTLLVSPYKLTPWNLVVRTLQYNPLIAAAKAGLEAKKGNTRAAEISAGRMVVGSLLYGAGYYLYQNGLIGPSLEGRGESQKARVLSGDVLPPNHVNISGLNRSLTGGDPTFQPGDQTVDLTRGGGAAGAILSSVANVGRKMERKPEAEGGEFAASLVRDGVLEQANFTINQSFLKGVTGLLDAIQNGNLGPYVTGVENMLLNVGVPNTLSALSRATREYAPDMRSDSVSEEFANVVKNRFGAFGADDYMTTKRGLFGEPLPQTPEGRNALLFHLFDISKGKQITDDPVRIELYRLWRKTADTTVIPSIPGRELTIERKTYPLPNDLYSKYAELVGQRRKEIADEMVSNPDFLQAPDEQKVKWLDSAWRKGLEFGKAKFLDEHRGELEPIKPRAGFK